MEAKPDNLEIKLIRTHNNSAIDQCVIKTSLNLSQEFKCLVNQKYNAVTKVISEDELKAIDKTAHVVIENILGLNTKATFNLFKSELEDLIERDLVYPGNKNVNNDSKIVNYDKCSLCTKLANCNCRRLTINGINIQYNILPSSDSVAIGVNRKHLTEDKLDAIRTLTEYHNIKLVCYDKIVSDKYTVIGINLHLMTLGLITNIASIISSEL